MMPDAAIAGLRESGIRGVYAFRPSSGFTPPWYLDPNNVYSHYIRTLRATQFALSGQ